jgi:anti-anti-sigma factor
MDPRDSLLNVAIHLDRTGDLVVRVEGELDMYTATRLRELTHKLPLAGTDHMSATTFDLSELQFADAAGLRGLTAAYRTLEGASEVVEVIPPLREGVRKVMSLTGADRRLGALVGPPQGGIAGPAGTHAVAEAAPGPGFETGHEAGYAAGHDAGHGGRPVNPGALTGRARGARTLRARAETRRGEAGGIPERS